MTSRDPDQRRRPRGARGVAGLTAVVALLLAASACSTPSPTVSSGPESAATAAPAAATAPAVPASAGASPSVPAPAASSPAPATPPDKSAAVAAALKTLIAATPQPSRDQVRTSLTAAGFPPAALEITASRTPTGLAADAVEVGVLDERACVMAQIRSGSVETSVLPVLPNGRCFVGSVQR